MKNNIAAGITDKPVKRSRLEPAKRRAQLLEHAISAFAEAGIERAVHADVAARANVSTPTVFQYFPNREALVDAVLSEIEARFEDLPTVLPEDVVLTSAGLIRGLGSGLSELCAARPDMMKVALAWSVAFSPVRGRYLDFEIRLLKSLSSTINAQAADTPDTRIIFAWAISYVRMHFDASTEQTRRDFLSRMCEIFDAAPKAVE